jgi:hypothetical protein
MNDKSAEIQQLRAGQHFYCPHCKSDSVLQIVHDFQGFQVISARALCAFCKTEIDGTLLAANGSSCSSSATAAPCSTTAGAKSALSSLLQLDSEERPAIAPLQDMLGDGANAASSAASSFCRDCYYYIHHPFLSRCSLHNRTVEPMHDCQSFRLKDGAQNDAGQKL